MQPWRDCKNILCIRADNMGDVIMSGPAMKALKDTFDCRITLLTSELGKIITPHLPMIDEVMVYNLPWVKTNKTVTETEFVKIIDEIRNRSFDAAVIFTVYSQNSLPASMLCFMAGIPLRLAYCHENPYELLTDWVPDDEPYSFIRHQVERDIALVKSVGAIVSDDHLLLTYSNTALISAYEKLEKIGIDLNKKWLILHPCVSEKKREYPKNLWIETATLFTKQTAYQLLITGTARESELTQEISHTVGDNAFSIAGLLSIEEFIALIDAAPLVISVNTGTVHIAAAMQTPVIVLYALTNPQHTPWKVNHEVFYFTNDEQMHSKNEVVKYVLKNIIKQKTAYPEPQQIVKVAIELLEQNFETDLKGYYIKQILNNSEQG